MKLNNSSNSSFDPWHCTLQDFHSADSAMTRCLSMARIAANTDLPILILGESGTGKTLLARAIHNSSKRADQPFVSFNAAALSDTLLDSQLFGHEKGAFTGALKTVKGKFETADQGTLFIDEIADMSLVAQAKILRAIEYGEFERLGSPTLQVADVRIISATHMPLHRFRNAGHHFRKDLFYRLSGIILTVPPLRQRTSDLPSLIAAEILTASQRLGKSMVALDKAAADLLFSHQWPGNLRELSRTIHVAVALSPGDTLSTEAIFLEPNEPDGSNGLNRSEERTGSNRDLSLKAAEQRHIQKVVKMMGGNKRQAARILGLSRSTLDRKLSS